MDEYGYGQSKSEGAPSTYITFSSRASGINATALAVMVASSLSLHAVPVSISMALLPTTDGSKKSYVVVDPTMEEEAKALARFGFAWAIGQGLNKTAASKRGSGMEVDGEEMDMELVWTESEGSFSKAEVRIHLYCTCGSSKSRLMRIVRGGLAG